MPVVGYHMKFESDRGVIVSMAPTIVFKEYSTTGTAIVIIWALYDLEASSSGIIIRDTKGLIMVAAYSWNRNISYMVAVETLAAIQAVQFSQKMGFHKVEVEGDLLVIVSKLRMQGLDRSEGGSPAGEGGLHSEEGRSMGGGGVSGDLRDSGGRGKGAV
ncbi:hypothetical protein Goshw_009913 [Gossypium schwendimanii]|uniref:RNase H type-1 domain-containing protein n=1 Tax=Gossypium schwendimanii TaxID=34291 RepID=A0A7J9L294_GOSSC|nr:hypothetical protein [Gossypium schwendimanii]